MTDRRTEPFNDADADLQPLRARRIAVVGYGSQGRAQALNLRDSGCDVRIGLYSGSRSADRAAADGFVVETTSDASRWADVISLLLPDQLHAPVFRESVAPALAAGKLLLVAHGLSIQYGAVAPPPEIDVALVAPIGPGRMVRSLYLEGFGVPAVIAVWRDVTGAALDLALAYAAGLGCTRAGVLPTTFQEETETDLFGEQAVLCGGLAELVKAGFDTLVDAGYQPEIAYFECLHQVKLIADLLYDGGLSGMNAAISDTAELGEYLSGPRVINEAARQGMRDVLDDIRSGAFARRWAQEWSEDGPELHRRRGEKESLLIERVGRRLRAMMTRHSS